MDFLQQLGPLALASRLKRLTDRLYRSGEAVYTALDTDFEPRWFMVFARLKHAGTRALPITAIADDLGVTHPGVIKLVGELERNGLATSTRDRQDARVRSVRLTARGRRLAAELEPVWAAFESATRELFREIGGDLIATLDRLESHLEKIPMDRRVIGRVGGTASPVEIVDFRSSWAGHFRRLNEAWLAEMFRVEPHDRRQLDNPQREVIDRGGEIIFARLGGRIVGTAALIRLSPRRFELAKMAVARKSRRSGAGTALLQAAIDRARRRGAAQLVLQTHPRHQSATRLYRRHGFETRPVRIPGAARLERARDGFTMVLDLNRTGRRRKRS